MLSPRKRGRGHRIGASGAHTPSARTGPRVETCTPGSPGPGRNPQTVGSRGNTAHGASSEDTGTEPVHALTGPLHSTPSRPRPIRAGTWAESWYQLCGGNIRNLALFLSCSAVACHGVRCHSAAGNTCTCRSVALRRCTPGCTASWQGSALPRARMSEPAGGLTKSTLDTWEGRACNQGRALRERCRRGCAQATEPNADGTSRTGHVAPVGRRHHSAHFCSCLVVCLNFPFHQGSTSARFQSARHSESNF